MNTALSFLLSWLLATWGLIESSAFWLLLGCFLAGMVRVFLPQRLIEKHLQQGGLGSVVKASAAGIPLPLCSCSVIPVAVALRKKGASRGATASFLISTPEIGVDSFLLSSALLSVPFACLRAFAAFVSALLVGILVDCTEEDSALSIRSVEDGMELNCAHVSEPRPRFRLEDVLRYAYVELLDDIALSLTVGLLLAGLVASAVPAGYFAENLSGFPAMLAMLFVSMPLYICATSSTPLAATLLAKGMDPSAVFVFLLAGPATNFASFLLVKNLLGKKALVIFISGVASVSLLVGWFGGALLVGSGAFSASVMQHEHRGWGATIAAFTFTLLLLLSLRRVLARKKSSEASCCQCP